MTTPENLASALADRYRIDRELGQGGMATVYLAEDLRHRRKVAIKVVHPELSAVIGSERFLKEIELTANLQHPHILPLFDSGSANGQLFYVMPFVEGESLRDRLQREKQLPIDTAVGIAKEVASALDYAHRHGVVHRDIKPENILLHDGRAVVADFGIALAMQQANGGRMTQTGMSLGTPSYMSPEQAMGEREIGPRSDVYALGAVTYEMLTGEAPFTGPTAQSIVAKVMTEEPASIILRRKTVPSTVEQAVLTALQKLPADRWGTAREFSEALSSPHVLTSSRHPARSEGSSRPHVLTSSRPAALPVLSAVAALSLLAAAAAWMFRPSPPAPPLARYEIRLPYFASQRLSYSGGSLAISPDGASIAYVARREQGERSLWVRDRDALEAHPIEGTDRADAPFFSPDGQWIAYFVDGRLFKVPVRGGPPALVADSANIAVPSGYWRTDGSIVFVGDPFDIRMTSTTGQAGVVQLAERPGAMAWVFPSELPGTDALLVTSCTNNCASMTLFALDVKTGKQVELAQNTARGWFVPSGHLISLRQDGSVFAQQFDPRTFTLSGAPVPLASNVRMRLGITGEMAFSRSGTMVNLEGTGAQDLRLVRVDRAGRRLPVDPDWRGSFNSFALSPDGKQLAISVMQGGHTDLWIKQLDRGPLTRLTFDGAVNYRAAWVPDDHSVGFLSDRTGRTLPYVARADGSSPATRVALPDTGQVDEIEWTKDGRWIVYRTGVVAGVRRIARYKLGDSAATAIEDGRFDQYMPTVSPDGRWLAYVTVESGREEVYVRPFPATSEARWQVSSAGGSSPVWSPSGKELFFVTAANRLVSVPVIPDPTFQTGAQANLFSIEGLVLPPYHQALAVMPDGQGFYFLEDQGGSGAELRYAIVTLNWLDQLTSPAGKKDK